jgi:hypothetical protein
LQYKLAQLSSMLFQHSRIGDDLGSILMADDLHFEQV